MKLLLDGQQRATTLYGVIRGTAPKFFGGQAKVFTGLYFNLDEEAFEFYAPAKMKGNPSWVDLTQLMRSGAGAHVPEITSLAAGDNDKLSTYFNRPPSDTATPNTQVTQIASREVHIEEVTGADKAVHVVAAVGAAVATGSWWTTGLQRGSQSPARWSFL